MVFLDNIKNTYNNYNIEQLHIIRFNNIDSNTLDDLFEGEHLNALKFFSIKKEAISVPPSLSKLPLYLIQKGNASAERINEILEIKNIENINSGEKITSIKKSIKFKNVSFSFGNKKIFRNLNLDIKKGETIAIVGHSGSGKSTLINLLLGFYEIENGEILIDNKKINCYKKNTYSKFS